MSYPLSLRKPMETRIHPIPLQGRMTLGVVMTGGTTDFEWQGLGVNGWLLLSLYES